MWSSGIDNWAEVYDGRLGTWLLAMKDAETEGSSPFKFSTYMRESWVSGRFWLNYAARKSWAFDTIFWKFLDDRFFGPRQADVSDGRYWATRVDLLEENEKRNMEILVRRKMDEMKERVLVDWDASEAKSLLDEMLGNFILAS
ncbi:unnamed protein product [Fusarium equiseti]|uniref:Uncharacterized protein n=1 Tax=Fusarium equiseti TaxID=61235 RepID=A0A8J2IRB6_FUSEQ|nr:unnamed protein product [Fusarium equiseti]